MNSANDELGAEEIWKEPVVRILARLATTTTGLDATEAQSRLKIFGPNDAATIKRSPLWLQFLSRFRNPLVIILLVASGLSAATGDVASFLIVVIIVTISMTIDFVQEVRAQNAVEALRRSVAVQATVRRDGARVSIPIDQLVPGDIVELIAGDLVPADSRLLESRDLFINQALLTGEPYPAEKQCSDAPSGPKTPPGRQTPCSPAPPPSAVQQRSLFAGPAAKRLSAILRPASVKSRRPRLLRSAFAGLAC
jgi:Mg2+-importing ATPase